MTEQASNDSVNEIAAKLQTAFQRVKGYGYPYIDSIHVDEVQNNISFQLPPSDKPTDVINQLLKKDIPVTAYTQTGDGMDNNTWQVNVAMIAPAKDIKYTQIRDIEVNQSSLIGAGIKGNYRG